jgi:hypothetical protein
MKLGRNVFEEGMGIVFAQTGKPFDGFGPVSVASAFGALVRSCEMNCYQSDGGDCCATRSMCENCECQPCGSVCAPPEDGYCISMTKAQYETEYGMDCSASGSCEDYSDTPCPASGGVSALEKQCPQKYFFTCGSSNKCVAWGNTLYNYGVCVTNTCYDTKAECTGCSDCDCNPNPVKTSSSSSNSIVSSSSSSNSIVSSSSSSEPPVLPQCRWVFTANYATATGVWQFKDPPTLGSDCVSPPYSFTPNAWVPTICSGETLEMQYNKVLGYCIYGQSDCPTLLEADYPDLPSGPPPCEYDCNYQYDAASKQTTYSCDAVVSGNFNNLSSCQEAISNTESGKVGIFECQSPRFSCGYDAGAPSKLSCVETPSGDYGSLESCESAITNGNCGFRFDCTDGVCSPGLFKDSGLYATKEDCEQQIQDGECATKYNCVAGAGGIKTCEKSGKFGQFNSMGECQSRCCQDAQEGAYPTITLGSCQVYEYGSMTECFNNLTKAQCDAKDNGVFVSSTWVCGSFCP